MSEKSIVRATAVQIFPVFERTDGTLSGVCEAIDQAAHEGVQVIVFLETFVPYYPCFSFARSKAASGAARMKLCEEVGVAPGPLTQAGAERVRCTSHAVSVNERDHGSLYNMQLVFDVDGRHVLKR